MGTRNLTCVVVNGKYKVAQYGQWDGYPTGQGDTVTRFIINNPNLDSFKEGLSKVRFIDYEKESEKMYKDLGIVIYNGMINMNDSAKFKDKYPQLDRDMGADILMYINDHSDTEEIILNNQIDFAKNSLFCEYAYIVNLDTSTLEVFKGFNTLCLNKTERFYSKEKPEEYYPIKLFKVYPFKALTLSTMEKLEKEMDEGDE